MGGAHEVSEGAGKHPNAGIPPPGASVTDGARAAVLAGCDRGASEGRLKLDRLA
jgi:hypothetical protein